MKADDISISSLTTVEIHSALKRRLIEKTISFNDYQNIINEYHTDLTDFSIVELNPAIFSKSIDLIKKHGTRTLDSLQLAAGLFCQPDFIIMSDTRLFHAAALEYPDKVEFIK